MIGVRFSRDETGSAMVEASIALALLLTLTLGFVDFGYAFYQWNAASKAVQVGARTASVSAPVVSTLATFSDNPPSPTDVGDTIAAGAYSYTCLGAGTPACNDNFSRIFRGDTVGTGCPDRTGTQRPGMCHFFPRLQPANVRITYAATGLGYWTRPGGPVPTITVSLEGLTFQFFFLGGLLGFDDITIPSMRSTVTGEDLKSTYP